MRATRAQARVYQTNLDGTSDDVTPRKKRFNEEAEHQRLLFVRRQALLNKYPDLRYLFSTLNGIFLPPGIRRNAVEQGLEKGILDVWLPVARTDNDGHWCGLALDLKKLKGAYPTPEQKEWALHLVTQGWRVYFPAGALDAWWIISAYIGIQGEDHFAPDLAGSVEFLRQIAG